MHKVSNLRSSEKAPFESEKRSASIKIGDTTWQLFPTTKFHISGISELLGKTHQGSAEIVLNLCAPIVHRELRAAMRRVSESYGAWGPAFERAVEESGRTPAEVHQEWMAMMAYLIEQLGTDFDPRSKDGLRKIEFHKAG